MPILSANYGNTLKEVVASATTELCLVSAFVTVAGTQPLLDAVRSSVHRKELHVRWRAEDLLCGASELRVYELAREYGFAVFMQNDLHAKFAVADRKKCVLGSANFTGRGIGIVLPQNKEAGVYLEIGPADMQEVDLLLDESVLITPDLHDKLQAFVEKNRLPSVRSLQFPDDISSSLTEQYIGLWVRDLPLSPWPPDELVTSITDSDVVLASRFCHSRCARWLRRLVDAAGDEIFFGELASSLHDSLLEDPTPYRTEVKKLASNLINWSTQLLSEEFKSDTPSHSQRLFRIKS